MITPTFDPLHCGRQPSLLPRSDTEIPCPIQPVRHCRHFRYSASDTLDGALLYHLLISRRQRQRYQSRHCRSTEWDTVDIFLPIIPDLSLLRLYYRRPCRPEYTLLSLSSVFIAKPHLLCCPHHIASLLHLCYCCLNILEYPPILPPHPLSPYALGTPRPPLPPLLNFYLPTDQ